MLFMYIKVGSIAQQPDKKSLELDMITFIFASVLGNNIDIMIFAPGNVSFHFPIISKKSS